MFELPSIRALSVHEKKNYSLQNLINSQLARQRKHLVDPSGPKPPACLEEEVSQAIASDLKMRPPLGGSFVPLIMGSLDTKSNPAGAYSVATRLGDLITYLRAKSVVLRLGAQLLDGVNSGIALPVQSAGSTANWVTENPGADVGQTDSSFAQLTPQPRTLQSTSAYSRQILAQSSIAIEEFLRTDLAAATAAALDLAALVGTGSAGQPVGVVNVAGVNNIAVGANGGSPAVSFLVQVEQAISDGNADIAPISWVTSPVMRSRLRQIPAFTGSSLPVWQTDEGQDELLGMPALVSKAIPSTLVKGTSSDCSLILAGAFQSMSIVQFGALAITADEYSSKKRGLIEVASHFMGDVVIRRPASFAFIADARNI